LHHTHARSLHKHKIIGRQTGGGFGPAYPERAILSGEIDMHRTL